jgi:hypothetical protein
MNRHKCLWSLAVLVALLGLGAWANSPAPAEVKQPVTVDCCTDPTCCLSTVTATAPARTAAEPCCPEGDWCPECSAQTSKTTAKAKKYVCPPCPFCP